MNFDLGQPINLFIPFTAFDITGAHIAAMHFQGCITTCFGNCDL